MKPRIIKARCPWGESWGIEYNGRFAPFGTQWRMALTVASGIARRGEGMGHLTTTANYQRVSNR